LVHSGAVVSCAILHRPENGCRSLRHWWLHNMVDAPVGMWRADYAHSLRAAFCCEEVEKQFAGLPGLIGLTVARVERSLPGAW